MTLLERLRAATTWFREFNIWFDEFILELSSRLLLLGFILGTIDVFARGGMATTSAFMVFWASIQALSIDGLFFAVWGKVSTVGWKDGSRKRLAAMFLTGIMLGFATLVVNGIVSYQDMYNIGDSLVAMNRLGFFTAQTFVIARAFLVVTCAVLVEIFCHTSDSVAVATVKQAKVVTRQVRRAVPTRSRRRTVVQEALEIPPIEATSESATEQLPDNVTELIAHVEQPKPKRAPRRKVTVPRRRATASGETKVTRRRKKPAVQELTEQQELSIV